MRWVMLRALASGSMTMCSDPPQGRPNFSVSSVVTPYWKYWARSLAEQNDDVELQQAFTSLAERMAADEDAIVGELVDCQGTPVDIGGYYQPDDALATAAMRPSPTLNGIIDSI